MEIKFEFASWKVKQLEKLIEEKSKRNYVSAYSMEHLQGQLKVWRDFMYATCQHQFEILPDGDGSVCKICGFEEHGWDELYHLHCDVTKGCHNCKYHYIEGGDWVPYGSSGAHLPTYDVCDCPEFYDEEGELISEEKLNECMKNSNQCPYWVGKEE
jgi:hypothetical protein